MRKLCGAWKLTERFNFDVNPSPEEYFREVYQKSKDPWNLASSEYEAEKYEASLHALPRDQYDNALEIGCSIGVFTARLAARCAHLRAIDVAEAAVAKAKERCKNFSNVSFEVMCLPEKYPDELFDLTVLSEVGYYLSSKALRQLSAEITTHAAPRGHLMLVHWLASVPGFELRGDDVHDHFLRLPEWRLVSNHRMDLYRIDVLERPSDAFARL